MKKLTLPISPLGDRLFVRRVEASTTTGTIFIPDSAQEKPQFGVVLSVGNVKDERLRSGVLVLFGKYSGMEIEVEREPVLLLREDEIMGVVTDLRFAQKLVP
jgi:chaperonin GroES